MAYFPTKVKPEGFASYQRRVSKLAEKQAAAAAAPPARSGSEDGRSGSSAQRLGNNTKSQAAFVARDSENPDLIQEFSFDPVRREYVEVKGVDDAVREARQGRFAAQGSATKLLFNHQTPRETQWRVTGCTRRKISDEVVVLHSESTGKAHYGNLMICGSVWTCPVCAAKISEGRKMEIKTASDQHQAAGGALYMVTYTFSHQRNDDLADLMARFSKARIMLRESRAYKRLLVKLGYVGDIRALEVTYGDANGWHPHEHGLWFVADPLTRAQQRDMMTVLFTLWEKACLKCGLAAPNRKRGVNIIRADSAADYMAKMGREQKWGVSSELAKQHIKAGSAGRYTPFDLLRSYHQGDKRHGALFIKYAEVFFGKRQVMWSRGLKAIFAIAIVDDQELAEQELCEDARKMTELTAFEWRVVLSQPYDVRALVLHLAETGQRSPNTTGEDAVRRYIDGLVFRSDLVPF